MTFRLVACPSCSNYVKADEPHCIVCGGRLKEEGAGVARTAGAVLMGLSLTACPTDDTSGDSMMSEGTMNPATESSASMSESMSGGSESTATGPGSSGSDSGSTTDPGTDSTTFAGESAYGVGATTIQDTDGETETTTGTTTDTTPGSTSVSPDYGVPD